MNVIHFLHKHALAKDLKDIRFVLPERVAVVSLPVFVPQFFERAFVFFLFQVLNHAMSDGSFEVAKNSRWLFVQATCQQVHVVGHNHIRKKQNAAGISRLVNCRTGDGFDRIGLKDRQAIFGDCRDVKRLIVL